MRLALGNRVVTSLFIAGAFVCLVSCSDRGSLIAPENARTAALFQVTEGQPQAAAGAGTQLGQYRRIWPHEDGRGWAYHLTSRTWDQPPPVLFPTRGDVPTISMDDAIRLLGTEPTGANPETSTGSYRLQFSGSVTTLSGRVAAEPSRDVGAGSGRAGHFEYGLLRCGARGVRVPGPLASRPPRPCQEDGSERIERARTVRLDVRGCGRLSPHAASWLRVGADRPVDRDLRGSESADCLDFLTPDLRPGSEFSLQLVPDLAPDVFLHARVLGWKSVETETGAFHRALDAAYLVDFGVTEIVDFDGNTLGYTRSSLFGTIDYVVGVGPVLSYERLRITVDPLDRGNSDETARLTGTLTAIP